MDTTSTEPSDPGRGTGRARLNGSTLTNVEMTVAVELKDLPLDERMKLVEELWDSIAADQNALPVTPEQKAELDLRLDAYAIDRNPGREASVVIADILRKL